VDRNTDNKAIAVFVGIGVLCGLAFGALVALIMRDRKQDRQQQQLSGGVHVWNLLSGQTPPWATALGAPAQMPTMMPSMQPQEIVQTTTPAINSELRPSVTQTLSLSVTQPYRVLNGGSTRHWRAQLRNVGPPGSCAYVSTDPTSLAYPSMCVVIPAGGFTDMRIRPGDGLFALGSVKNVQLSIAASEEVA
jgi:hypothetical protein